MEGRIHAWLCIGFIAAGQIVQEKCWAALHIRGAYSAQAVEAARNLDISTIVVFSRYCRQASEMKGKPLHV